MSDSLEYEEYNNNISLIFLIIKVLLVLLTADCRVLIYSLLCKLFDLTSFCPNVDIKFNSTISSH